MSSHGAPPAHDEFAALAAAAAPRPGLRQRGRLLRAAAERERAAAVGAARRAAHRLARWSAGNPRAAARLAWVVVALAVVPQPWHQLTVHVDRMIDLHVYRDAAVSVLHHRSVYDHYTTTRQHSYPFTYPAVAALLAVPLGVLPALLDGLLWDAAVYGLLLWLVLRLAPSVRAAIGPRWAVPVAAPGLFLVAAYLMPVRDQVRFGQVGLFLLVAVVADLLTPATGRWRGVLVGLVTAVKLTPGVFLPYLWFTGRRREAVVGAGTFVGLTGLGWLLDPRDSQRFWTYAVLHSERLGANDYTSNQSLRGVLLKSALPAPAVSALTALLLLVVAAVGYSVAVAASRRGDELSAVTTVGLLAVLLSPVAWIHHLTWIVLVLVVLLRQGRPRLAAAVAVGYTLPLPWWGLHLLRHGVGPEWLLSPVWRVLQNSFGLGALALVLLPVAGPALRARTQAADGPPLGAGRPGPLPPDGTTAPRPAEPYPVPVARSGGG